MVWFWMETYGNEVFFPNPTIWKINVYAALISPFPAAFLTCSHLPNWFPLHSFHVFFWVFFSLVNQYANDMILVLHWAVSLVISKQQQLLADCLPPKSRLRVIWKQASKVLDFQNNGAYQSWDKLSRRVIPWCNQAK